MATFTGQQIKNTYDSILKLEDNDSLTSVLKKVQDGLGNDTPLSVSSSAVKSTVNIEATGFYTPTGLATEYLMADGSVSTGISGDINYTHDQTVASLTWNINHGLGKFPSVSIVDTSGNLVYGSVSYTDNNNLTINFTSVFQGKAYLN